MGEQTKLPEGLPEKWHGVYEALAWRDPDKYVPTRVGSILELLFGIVDANQRAERAEENLHIFVADCGPALQERDQLREVVRELNECLGDTPGALSSPKALRNGATVNRNG